MWVKTPTIKQVHNEMKMKFYKVMTLSVVEFPNLIIDLDDL